MEATLPQWQLSAVARVASVNVWCHSDPDWQLPDWPQGAAAILGPVVAPNPVSQCAIARMETTGNCQSGARVAKICCVVCTCIYLT